LHRRFCRRACRLESRLIRKRHRLSPIANPDGDIKPIRLRFRITDLRSDGIARELVIERIEGFLMARSASKIKPTSPSSSSISFGLPSGGIYYRLCEHQLSRARNLESDFPGADDTAIATHRWLDSISLSLSLSLDVSRPGSATAAAMSSR